MYGGDPYSFTAYPQVDSGRRVGRDPKIESLPTSASDAQYDKAFVDSKCMACGRNKGDARVCRPCSEMIRDRFGKDSSQLPDRAILQMRWAQLDEEDAKAAGKDIKLNARRNAARSSRRSARNARSNGDYQLSRTGTPTSTTPRMAS